MAEWCCHTESQSPDMTSGWMMQLSHRIRKSWAESHSPEMTSGWMVQLSHRVTKSWHDKWPKRAIVTQDKEVLTWQVAEWCSCHTESDSSDMTIVWMVELLHRIRKSWHVKWLNGAMVTQNHKVLIWQVAEWCNCHTESESPDMTNGWTVQFSHRTGQQAG